MSKRVSVIVVNYNGSPHLDQCIPAILNQTHPDFEVILVDNCSSDTSLDYARMKFPTLKFVANDKNVGYAGGINTGLVHSTGDYIAPLNIDTEVAPTWLSAMADFMDENLHVGAVAPKILLFDERTRINALGSNVHITGLGFCRKLGLKDDFGNSPEKVSGVSGCSYLIRREIIEKIGWAFDECFMANDDVIVSWLVNLMGYEIYCVPQAVVYHKYRLRMNPEKLYSLERNREILLLSTLTPWTLVVFFPVFAATELLILSYCILRGRSYLKAKRSASIAVWKERDSVRAKRDLSRQLRRISDIQLFRRLRWGLEWTQVRHTTQKHTAK